MNLKIRAQLPHSVCRKRGKPYVKSPPWALLQFYTAPESGESHRGTNEIVKQSSETWGVGLSGAWPGRVNQRLDGAESWFLLERGLETMRPGPRCLGTAHANRGRKKQSNYRGSGATRGAFVRLG